MATAKPVVKAAPAKPAGPTVNVKVKIGGKIKTVAMPKQKALALAAKRRSAKEINETSSYIPSLMRGSVDPAGINAAVKAQINSLNAPIEAQKTTAQRQFDDNVAANSSLAAQTQASLDQLLANSSVGARDLASLNIQREAAGKTANAASAAQAGHMLGMSMNPQVASMVEAGVDPLNAAQAADQTRATVGDRLMQQAQSDFFQRGKGIAAITQQSFNEGQRKQLTNVLAQLSAQQTANSAKKADLVRQFAQEDYTLASTIGAGQAAAQQQAIENSQKDYANETSRLNVVTDAQNAQAATAAKQSAALTSAQRKSVADVHKLVDGLVARTTKVVSVRDRKTGKIKSRKPSMAEVFPSSKGPWRDAFNRLIADDVGLSRDQAAKVATQWYANSWSRETTNPRNIKALLDNRGVSAPVQKAIIQQVFGQTGWKEATTKPLTDGQKQLNAAKEFFDSSKGADAVFNGQTFKLTQLGSYKGVRSYIFTSDAGIRYVVPVSKGTPWKIKNGMRMLVAGGTAI